MLPVCRFQSVYVLYVIENQLIKPYYFSHTHLWRATYEVSLTSNPNRSDN